MTSNMAQIAVLMKVLKLLSVSGDKFRVGASPQHTNPSLRAIFSGVQPCRGQGDGSFRDPYQPPYRNQLAHIWTD